MENVLLCYCCFKPCNSWDIYIQVDCKRFMVKRNLSYLKTCSGLLLFAAAKVLNTFGHELLLKWVREGWRSGIFEIQIHLLNKYNFKIHLSIYHF